VQSPFIQNLWLYGGLVIFSLFVAVDTQVIIERALRGDSDSVHSALDLFLDALNIFVRIMIILSRDKKSSSGGSIV
jgi:FtsH-binding integral membrane protein